MTRPGRTFRSTVSGTLLVLLAIAGCNAILDNKPALQRDTAAPAPSADTSPQMPHVAPGTDGYGDAGGDDGTGRPPPCAAGQQMCHGYCVGLGDPRYGCGARSCEPCSIAHGTSACQDGACAVQACDRGFADCDKAPANGCETDLSRASSCGACGVACPPATPVCSPAGDGFRCTTGCSPAAPVRCGDECVDPLASIHHCGDCDVRCREIDHATVECIRGRCGLTCKPGYRACGSKCVVKTDPSACGPACTRCPVPPNATAACQADTCAFLCNVGFGNCNQDPQDGCEARFADDPKNCGGCGKSCDGGACRDGACSTEPADAKP